MIPKRVAVIRSRHEYSLGSCQATVALAAPVFADVVGFKLQVQFLYRLASTLSQYRIRKKSKIVTLRLTVLAGSNSTENALLPSLARR